MTRRKSEADFWSKVVKQDDGCWAWIGGMCGDGPGYHYNGERLHARRIAWALVKEGGEISERWTSGRCGNRMCVNPDHTRQGLLPDDLPDILSAMRRGLKHDAIADQYGVHRCTLVRYLGRHTRGKRR